MPGEPTTSGDNRDEDLQALLQKAAALHEAGDWSKADSLYRDFLERKADHPMALQLFGLLHSQRKDYPRAIQLMQKSLQLFPEQPEVANNLGNALKRYGRLEDAIESYSRAIELYPDYLEAIRNKTLALQAQNRIDEAEACIRRALEIRPDDPVSWLILGNVHQQKRDYDAAISCLEKALQLNPDYADAHHNLGLCLRLKNEAPRALEHYRAAQNLGLDRAELYHNLGNALVDELELDAAIDAYRKALQRNPLDLDSHKNLNTLLWQQEQLDDYLQSFRQALSGHPEALPLRLAYAVSLFQKGAYDECEGILRDGLRLAEGSSQLRSLLAMSLEGQREWDKALSEHAAAVNSADSIPDHRISYARALLACQRPDEALQQAQLGTVPAPFNQRALAYLGLCWRQLDDPRDAFLNDYEHMVRVYDVPIPAEVGSAAEFNERLAAVLARLHIGKRHPPEQTLRGGSQTYGDLFDRREPEIVQLVEGIRRCVEDYIGRMPQHSDHPLLVRRSERYDFAASWSVRLASCGYHVMHVHPLGWISSAYYVQVPPEVSKSDSDAGGIKFGEPDIDLGESGSARRLIKPEAGKLVLFPSYMWHGTIPFESGDPRMTVAFDVVPATKPPPTGS